MKKQSMKSLSNVISESLISESKVSDIFKNVEVLNRYQWSHGGFFADTDFFDVPFVEVNFTKKPYEPFVTYYVLNKTFCGKASRTNSDGSDFTDESRSYTALKPFIQKTIDTMSIFKGVGIKLGNKFDSLSEPLNLYNLQYLMVLRVKTDYENRKVIRHSYDVEFIRTSETYRGNEFEYRLLWKCKPDGRYEFSSSDVKKYSTETASKPKPRKFNIKPYSGAINKNTLKKFSNGDYLDDWGEGPKDWNKNYIVGVMIDGDNYREYWHDAIRWTFNGPLTENDIAIINAIAKKDGYEPITQDTIDSFAIEDWSPFNDTANGHEYIVCWFGDEPEFCDMDEYQGPINHDEDPDRW